MVLTTRNRLPIRATRYRLRYDGLSALERQKQKSRMKIVRALLLADDDDCDEAAVDLLRVYMRTKRKGWRNIQAVQRTNMRIARLTEEYSWNNLRFRKVHLQPLLIAWDVPRSIVLSNRSVYNGEEAFLLFLRKVGKGVFTVDLEKEFGRENSQLGRALRALIDLLYEKHKHLLFDNLDFFEDRWEEFNLAIRRKIQQKYPGQDLSFAAKRTGNHCSTLLVK